MVGEVRCASLAAARAASAPPHPDQDRPPSPTPCTPFPTRRPTPEQVLAHPTSIKWFKVLPTPQPARRYSENGGVAAGGAPSAAPSAPPSRNASAGSLMDTIMVPRWVCFSRNLWLLL